MKIKKPFFILFLMITIFNFCDKNPSSPEYQKEVVINGFLWGNEYLTKDRALMINYSRPIDEPYNLNNAAIKNAVVLLKNHSTGNEYELNEIPGRAGFYYNEKILIQPKTTYSLKVEVDAKIVTATTTVPPNLVIETKLKADTVNFTYPDEFGFSKPIKLDCENEEQIIYVDMFCNENWENAEFINHFGPHDKPDSRDQYAQGKNAEPRHIQAYMRLKDLVSDIYPDEYVIFWYQAMFVFYGSNTMQVLAIDENYHNFLHKEHAELNGGVSGGIGILGSVCGKKFDFIVMKKKF